MQFDLWCINRVRREWNEMPAEYREEILESVGVEDDPALEFGELKLETRTALVKDFKGAGL